MRRQQAGFSLIELMISIVIGLVVIGAVMAAYLGSGISSRNTRALAQITEDASVAMNVLRANIGMAGYSAPTGINAGKFQRAYNGAALMACDGPFRDLDADMGSLACDADGAVDSIAVVYQADDSNSVTNDDGEPLDCLGNGITGAAPLLAYHRFYLEDGSLFCRGPGNASGQALVNNVVDMQFEFGVGPDPVAFPDAKDRRVRRYEDPGDMNATDFNSVLSVRVCMVIASESEVMDAATPYVNCNGDEETPDDRRLYRPFSSTIVLQNRLGGVR